MELKMEIKNICIQAAVLESNGDVSEGHASSVFDGEGNGSKRTLKLIEKAVRRRRRLERDVANQ